MRDVGQLKVAVVGATGAVGREMLSILESRAFQFKELQLFASERSFGSVVEFDGQELPVRALVPDCFQGIDIALFSAGGAVSKEWAPIAAKSGAVVIDNSSTFRMEPNVPLIVPEVNADFLRDHLTSLKARQGVIIANPNCSTIQLVVVLHPIHREVGLQRVVVSTYQSVSGAGKKGMDELFAQVRALFNYEESEPKAFPHPIAFNCIPHIDSFLESGYTKEEMKIVNETRKILSLPDLRITATAVRVPVFSCHSESVNVETERSVTPDQIRSILRESPGVVVQDDPEQVEYPLSRALAGSDATFVGRIRQDTSIENGLNLWIVADNLRKGAALNAVQIAEIVRSIWAKH